MVIVITVISVWENKTEKQLRLDFAHKSIQTHSKSSSKIKTVCYSIPIRVTKLGCFNFNALYHMALGSHRWPEQINFNGSYENEKKNKS